MNKHGYLVYHVFMYFMHVSSKVSRKNYFWDPKVKNRPKSDWMTTNSMDLNGTYSMDTFYLQKWWNITNPYIFQAKTRRLFSCITCGVVSAKLVRNHQVMGILLVNVGDPAWQWKNIIPVGWLVFSTPLKHISQWE